MSDGAFGFVAAASGHAVHLDEDPVPMTKVNAK